MPPSFGQFGRIENLILFLVICCDNSATSVRNQQHPDHSRALAPARHTFPSPVLIRVAQVIQTLPDHCRVLAPLGGADALAALTHSMLIPRRWSRENRSHRNGLAPNSLFVDNREFDFENREIRFSKQPFALRLSEKSGKSGRRATLCSGT